MDCTKYVACSGTRDGTDTLLDEPRTGDAESASDSFTQSEAFNMHRREKKEKKNIRKYAIGINSTNKFRNWLGVQLLYFATKIDAKNSLETGAMWHNNQGERQL
jgi:hypothetical protein